MSAQRFLDHGVVVRELLPQDLKLEIDELSVHDWAQTACYLAFVVGQAHARQMDMAMPGWLWKSVIELLAEHERLSGRLPPPCPWQQGPQGDCPSVARLDGYLTRETLVQRKALWRQAKRPPSPRPPVHAIVLRRACPPSHEIAPAPVVADRLGNHKLSIPPAGACRLVRRDPVSWIARRRRQATPYT